MTIHTLKPKTCRWCCEEHPEEQCPRVSARSFYETGALARVEFFGDPVFEFGFDDDPEAG